MKNFLISTLFLWSVQLVNAQSPSRHLQIHLSGALSTTNPEELGIMHNDALEFVLSSIKIEKGTNAQFLFKQYNELMSQFFYKRGLPVQFIFSGELAALDKEINHNLCLQTHQLSEEAKSFACSVEQAFQDLLTMRISVDQFVRKMEELMLMSKKYVSEHEQILCGLTAAVAKHSISFWSKNYERYYMQFENIFTKADEPNRGPSFNDNDHLLSPQQKIRWWSVAVSDVYGAWNWGRFGVAAGGGVGVASLGIAGAAWHSGTSVITQATLKTVK